MWSRLDPFLHPPTWMETHSGGGRGRGGDPAGTKAWLQVFRVLLLPDVSTDPIYQHFHSSGALASLLAWLKCHFFIGMTKPKHNSDIVKLNFFFFRLFFLGLNALLTSLGKRNDGNSKTSLSHLIPLLVFKLSSNKLSSGQLKKKPKSCNLKELQAEELLVTNGCLRLDWRASA